MANVITSDRREHGGMMLDGIQVATTLMCPHCGSHFESFPGSGRRRTYCLKCSAVTCGHKLCDPCIPLEARLDSVEGKKTRYDDEIRSLVANGAILL